MKKTKKVPKRPHQDDEPGTTMRLALYTMVDCEMGSVASRVIALRPSTTVSEFVEHAAESFRAAVAAIEKRRRTLQKKE